MRRWMSVRLARLVAADPGMRRLRAALRVIAGVVLTLVALVPGLLALGMSPISGALGAVVALLGQLAVFDASKRAQAVTTLLLPVSASASLAIVSLLSPIPLVADLAFVVLMFAASYTRRFGARAGALGMAAFVAFFLGLFLRVGIAQVPVMAVCGLVGAGLALLARFVLVPDRPRKVWRSGIRSLRARVRTLLDAMDDALEEPGPKHGRLVHDELMRLNQTALAVEGDLTSIAGAGSDDSERLRREVLDVELAAGSLVTALVGVLDESEDTTEIRRALSELGASLRVSPRDAAETVREAADRLESGGSAATALALRRLGAAAAALTEATITLEADEPDTSDKADATRKEEGRTDEGQADEEETDQEQAAGDEDTAAEDSQDTEDRAKEMRYTTRVAIQVACAGALAIVFGQLLSTTRWYWAVITAFVVFAGTGSRGELLVKAWRRLVGTLFGVLAGVGVALLVSGHPIVEVCVVLVCVFLAFYLMSVSYALMTFFITLMLGVLYEILGRFSVYVLELRLAETAIGAAAGIIAALLLLPARTRTVVRDTADDLLKALGELLRDAATDLDSGTELRDLTAGARTVDQRMQALLTSASPLGSYRVGNSRAGYERWRLLISSSAYYSRTLAVTLGPVVDLADEDTRSRLAGLTGTLAELAELISTRDFTRAPELFDTAERQEHELVDLTEALPHTATSLHSVVHTLGRLRGVFVDLAKALGESSARRDKRIAGRPA